MTIEDADPSGFEGLWRMDRSQSLIHDKDAGGWKPEELEDQTIELRHEGAVQTYKIMIRFDADLVTHMGYTCAFGAPDWAPYTVLKIDGDPQDARLQPGDLLKQGTRLGEPIALVKQIYVDPRTHYRITKNPDGTAQYAMLRRLSEDGNTLVSTVLTAQGIPECAKYFVRES
jgi:hypothetical protein